jgi:hypothetical protein
MGFAIHDKTKEGRRKLKEGPKAQQRYLEELQAEWIDNHATKSLPKRPPNWREAEVPENIRAKYLHAEAATRDQYLGQVNAQIEVLQKQTRAEVVARVARQEMQMYGYVLDKTWDEMLDLGIDPTEFDIVKAPSDEDDD